MLLFKWLLTGSELELDSSLSPDAVQYFHQGQVSHIMVVLIPGLGYMGLVCVRIPMMFTHEEGP